MRRDPHALVEVKAMGGGAVRSDARVQMELATAKSLSLLDHPVQQQPCVPATAKRAPGRKVVAVERVTPCQVVEHPKSGRGGRLLAVAVEGSNQPVALLALLLIHCAHEVRGRADMRSKLQHRDVREVGFPGNELSDHPPI